MERRKFLKNSGAALAVTTLAGALPVVASGDVKGAKPLNLLFITADDLNWSLPGFTGGKYSLTPRLDVLAARSHCFINNRTTNPICQPSREAMMTGLVPHHSGAMGFNPIKLGTPTLTSILKGHGYHTVAIHKTEHMQPLSCFPWDEMHPGIGRNPTEYEEKVREGIARARELKRPFFINCNLNDPHRPFYETAQANEAERHMGGDLKVPKPLQAHDVEVPSFLENLPAVREEFSQYCNNIQRMDITIGKVLDVLRASPEAENTVVLFTVDHGMPFPFSKATCYDNGTRTPALLSWPGMGKARVFDELTLNIDLLPTLLDVLGAPAQPGLDGRSWAPIMQNKAAGFRDYAITHVNTLNGGMAFPMRAVQNHRYSLVFSPWADGSLYWRGDGFNGLTYKAMAKAGESDPRIAARVKQCTYGIPLAFYDLEADPDQRVNRLDDAKHKEEVAKMKQVLLDYMQGSGDPQLENYKLLLAGGKPVVVQPVRHGAAEA